MLAAALVALLLAEEAPLPEGNAYVRQLVEKQRRREEVLDRYTYDVVSVREDLDDKGRVRGRRTERHEVFHVKGRPVRRKVAEGGRPLSAKEQAKEDAEARELAESIRRETAITEQPGVRLSAILGRYDFRSVAREDVAGRPAIVLEFQPLPGERDIKHDRLLRRVGGRIWVDEEEEEVVRAELANLAPLKFALGLGASVASAHVRLEFRKVDDAVWLPSEDETTASGRMLVFKKFRTRVRRTYERYRQFTVESVETIPKSVPF
jgi:hypothetical protein